MCTEALDLVPIKQVCMLLRTLQLTYFIATNWGRVLQSAPGRSCKSMPQQCNYTLNDMQMNDFNAYFSGLYALVRTTGAPGPLQH